MLNRIMRGRARSQAARAAAMGESPWDEPGPSDEPSGPASVTRVLNGLSALDWVRFAAVESAKQAAPGSVQRYEDVYRRASEAARRASRYEELASQLTSCQVTASWIAEKAAGPKAKAAWDRFQAVAAGRGGLLVDRTESEDVLRYTGFFDAASNALKASALRPYISRPDFAYMWQGFETVLDFRNQGETSDALDVAPVQVAASPKERYEEAVLAIQQVLPTGSRTPVLSFARLMVAILRLDDAQLNRIRITSEAGDGIAWLTAFSALSDDALRVGFWVRWVRWPNPTDEAANAAFRVSMDPAAQAVESAAAALADPNLSAEQVATLYRPFAEVIPLEALRIDLGG